MEYLSNLIEPEERKSSLTFADASFARSRAILNSLLNIENALHYILCNLLKTAGVFFIDIPPVSCHTAASIILVLYLEAAIQLPLLF